MAQIKTREERERGGVARLAVGEGDGGGATMAG